MQSSRPSINSRALQIVQPKQDFRAFNVAKIEATLKHGWSLKVTGRKLTIEKNSTYALRDAIGDFRNNIDNILKIAKEFYRRLFASSPATFFRKWCGLGSSGDNTLLATELQTMMKGKFALDGGITSHMFLGGQVVLTKLAVLFTQCFSSLGVPKESKNAY